MLELRPTCENCNAALPPSAAAAMICTFECTFCRPCVENVLGNVCPNCGGGFSARPIRPAKNWKGHLCLSQYPPTPRAKHRPVDVAAHEAFSRNIKAIPPEKR